MDNDICRRGRSPRLTIAIVHKHQFCILKVSALCIMLTPHQNSHYTSKFIILLLDGLRKQTLLCIEVFFSRAPETVASCKMSRCTICRAMTSVRVHINQLLARSKHFVTLTSSSLADFPLWPFFNSSPKRFLFFLFFFVHLLQNLGGASVHRWDGGGAGDISITTVINFCHYCSFKMQLEF